MTHRLFRGSFFLCLLLTMAITLTGCAAFQSVVEVVKGVVTTVKDGVKGAATFAKNTIEKAKEVIKPVTDAIGAGKDAIKQVKDIVTAPSSEKSAAPSASSAQERTAKSPDEEDDSTGAAAKAKTDVKTVVSTVKDKVADLSQDAKAATAKVKELVDKAVASKTKVEKEIESLSASLKKLSADDPLQNRVKEAIADLEGAKSCLEAVANGKVESQKDLDRSVKALDAVQKEVNRVLADSKAIGDLVMDTLKKAEDFFNQDWLKKIFGEDTTAKKADQPSTPKATAPAAPKSDTPAQKPADSTAAKPAEKAGEPSSYERNVAQHLKTIGMPDVYGNDNSKPYRSAIMAGAESLNSAFLKFHTNTDPDSDLFILQEELIKAEKLYAEKVKENDVNSGLFTGNSIETAAKKVKDARERLTKKWAEFKDLYQKTGALAVTAAADGKKVQEELTAARKKLGELKARGDVSDATAITNLIKQEKDLLKKSADLEKKVQAFATMTQVFGKP